MLYVVADDLDAWETWAAELIAGLEELLAKWAEFHRRFPE